jgi:2-keto-4-pentenoate hydratase/2-oxohepta-3-ene-1,7-dioic acid hydratase (catechol pathway)
VHPSKILCPALNFKSHSGETKQKNPQFPYFFSKFQNAIIPWNGKIKCHNDIRKLDYEGEIAAIIGRIAYGIPEDKAHEYIGGYAVVNDVSARDFQSQYSENLGKNWIMAKASDTFLPISNTVFLGTAENFNIRTEVNGELRQNSNTDEMIFSFPYMVSYLSQHITLLPGDIILSGTPEGVAASGKYPFLKHNDIVKISSEKIGVIENMID